MGMVRRYYRLSSTEKSIYIYTISKCWFELMYPKGFNIE